MAGPLSPAETFRRAEAWMKGIEAGASFASIARSLGMKPNTFKDWRTQYASPAAAMEAAKAPQPVLEPATPSEPEASPVERHDAAFWRRRAREHEREVERLHRIAEELAGVRAAQPVIPEWTRPAASSARPSALIVHTSDWHDGEVITPDELQGVNEFNPDICERRLHRLIDAACEMGTRWQADTEPRGVVFTLAGDLISGDIHEELTRTNALTAHEQVRHAAGVAIAMIRRLLDAFGRVHVVAVPGNHGRTTPRPTAKLYGRLSYDILIAAQVSDDFQGDDRVTWQIDGGTDQMLPVFGWRVLVTHGDKIGTGGGMGFAGPVLPILRGTHKVRAQQSALGAAPDLILMGHYHTSCAVPGVLANGSVPGYSEYGRDIRGGVEPPKQWLALITERWGLRERCDVQLEPPALRAKPRIRVPVQMSRA